MVFSSSKVLEQVVGGLAFNSAMLLLSISRYSKAQACLCEDHQATPLSRAGTTSWQAKAFLPLLQSYTWAGLKALGIQSEQKIRKDKF